MKLVSPDEMRVDYHYLFYEIDIDEWYKYISLFQLTEMYLSDTMMDVIERGHLFSDVTKTCYISNETDTRHLRTHNQGSVRRYIFELTAEEYYRQIILEEI